MAGTKLKKPEKRQKGFLYYLKGSLIPAGAWKAKMARGGKKKKKKAKTKKKPVKRKKVTKKRRK